MKIKKQAEELNKQIPTTPSRFSPQKERKRNIPTILKKVRSLETVRRAKITFKHTPSDVPPSLFSPKRPVTQAQTYRQRRPQSKKRRPFSQGRSRSRGGLSSTLNGIKLTKEEREIYRIKAEIGRVQAEKQKVEKKRVEQKQEKQLIKQILNQCRKALGLKLMSSLETTEQSLKQIVGIKVQPR